MFAKFIPIWLTDVEMYKTIYFAYAFTEILSLVRNMLEKKVNEYDHEMPQSYSRDQPTSLRTLLVTRHQEDK